MHIEIDDDLAEAIEEHMRLDESYDDVVRRLLRRALDVPTPPRSEQQTSPRSRAVIGGTISDLIRTGLVQAGDPLRFREARRGTVHEGRIEPDGRITTSKATEVSPSAALRNLLGYNVNGWTTWVHVPSGKTLSALRDGLTS